MIKSILKNNSGDENISKLIWVAIVFVCGAILLGIIYAAFNGIIRNWYNNTMNSWFKDSNGGFSVTQQQTSSSGVQNPGGTGFFGDVDG